MVIKQIDILVQGEGEREFYIKVGVCEKCGFPVSLQKGFVKDGKDWVVCTRCDLVEVEKILK